MMQKSTLIISCLSGLIPLLSPSTFAGNLTDPFEILNAHYESVGGLENLRAEKSTYFEAQFVLVGTGLEGPFKQWSKSPVQSRQELDLKVFKQTSGDDGSVGWVVDTNGKLKILRDDETNINRELTRLMAEFAHLDPDSEHFTVTCEGTADLDGVMCYVIKITNNLNVSELKYFINQETFLMEKSIIYGTDGGETHNAFSDYREVDGILRAFSQRTETVPTHQVQEITLAKLETNIELDDSLFSPPEEKVDDFRFTSGNRSTDVDFLFHENHIYMYVTVNCDRQLWILDSGAGATVIDNLYAEELGLASEGTIKGQGVSNTLDMGLVMMPGLSVEGIEIAEQRAVSVDLQGIFGQLMDLDVKGILGYDFMSRFVSKIDYANEKISFYHPDHFTYAGEGVVIDAPLNNQNMFTVPMTVEGKYSGQWRFDTGANGSGFHHDFSITNGFTERHGVERQAFGAGGSHITRRVQFSGANIAGFDLPPLEISVPMEAGHGAMAEKSMIGNLGSNVFRHFVVYLDYERQQIIFEKGDDFGKSFPTDNSGVQIWYPGGEKQMEIRFIAPGTAGEKAGLQVDDRILAVNAIPVEQLNGLHAFRVLMHAQPGTAYDVSILRDGQKLELTLVLEDPFH